MISIELIIFLIIVCVPTIVLTYTTCQVVVPIIKLVYSLWDDSDKKIFATIIR